MRNNSTQFIKDCKIGKKTKIWHFVNLYGCQIGDECIIGTFVEIQQNVIIGNRVKIQSHTFICSGVTIENGVFIGHGVMFINDRYPKATTKEGRLMSETDWIEQKTYVKKGASIGSNATILGDITIGQNAVVGAGAVVTKNVPANTIVAGNPAKILRRVPS